MVQKLPVTKSERALNGFDQVERKWHFAKKEIEEGVELNGALPFHRSDIMDLPESQKLPAGFLTRNEGCAFSQS